MDLSVKSYSYNNRPSFTARYSDELMNHVLNRGYEECDELIHKSLPFDVYIKPTNDASEALEKISSFLKKMHDDIEFSRILDDGEERPWGLNFNFGKNTIKIKPALPTQEKDIVYTDDSVLIQGLPSPGNISSYTEEQMSTKDWLTVADKIAQLDPKVIEHTFLKQMIEKVKSRAVSELMTTKEIEETVQPISKFAEDINSPEAANIKSTLEKYQSEYLQTMDIKLRNNPFYQQLKPKLHLWFNQE